MICVILDADNDIQQLCCFAQDTRCETSSLFLLLLGVELLGNPYVLHLTVVRLNRGHSSLCWIQSFLVFIIPDVFHYLNELYS